MAREDLALLQEAFNLIGGIGPTAGSFDIQIPLWRRNRVHLVYKCNVISENSLISLWSQGVQAIDPIQLFGGPRSRRAAVSATLERSAVLCWGKAAFRTWEAIAPRLPLNAPALVIGPCGALKAAKGMTKPGRRLHPALQIEAEHPLPGPGSFAAGRALLDFFDTLRRLEIRRLEVYLSGGASSLAWIPPAHWSPDRLGGELRRLYAQPLTISELNRKRAKLCVLKGGGSARWLKRLAPRVRVRVQVLSDVVPFGPEVVGSGPFWDGEVPHTVIADNSVLVQSLVKAAQKKKISVIEARSDQSGDWDAWVRRLVQKAEISLQRHQTGLIVCGGEPQVDLSRVHSPGRGGRQSQIGAALLVALAGPIQEGRLEILCMSSDGVDGRSGSAGTQAGQAVGIKLMRSKGSLRRLEQSLSRLDTGPVLRDLGALIPESPSGTNVQDVVMIRIL